MRNLPKAVVVAGAVIPVLRQEIPEEAELFGYYQPNESGATIVVDSRLRGNRELSVFMHELVHAIDEGAGIGLKHSQVAGLGELLAQSLAPHLKFG